MHIKVTSQRQPNSSNPSASSIFLLFSDLKYERNFLFLQNQFVRVKQTASYIQFMLLDTSSGDPGSLCVSANEMRALVGGSDGFLQGTCMPSNFVPGGTRAVKRLSSLCLFWDSQHPSWNEHVISSPKLSLNFSFGGSVFMKEYAILAQAQEASKL